MSKIFSFYADDVDHVWFQSSNIRYAECIDHDNELKTLKVVFNNGTQYQYNKVNVQDYLLFRNDASQGKALNQYIKGRGYEYEKLEDADMQSLEDELNFRMEDGKFVLYDGETYTLKNNKDEIIVETKVKLTEQAFNVICQTIEGLGNKIYADGKGFVDEGSDEYKSITEEIPF